MPIVGFNFTKISIEKKPFGVKQVQVKNDLKLGKVELSKRYDVTHADVARFNFVYEVRYGEMGSIDLEGYVLYSDKADALKKLVDQWEKEKEIPLILLNQVLNASLLKCNIKALELAQDVGLPPHFELPKINMAGAAPKAPEKSQKK